MPTNEGIAALAHVAVVTGERVVLRRRLDGGRPVLEAPAVEIRSGETPGLAAQRAAREHLGIDVRIGELVFADTEHGREHYFFLAEPAPGQCAEPTLDSEYEAIGVRAILAYVVEPWGLAVGLARHLGPRVAR